MQATQVRIHASVLIHIKSQYHQDHNCLILQSKKMNVIILVYILLLYDNANASEYKIGARMKPLIIRLCPYALDTVTDVINIKTYYDNSPDTALMSQKEENASIPTEPNVERALVSLLSVLSPSWCTVIGIFMAASRKNKLNMYILLLLLALALTFGPIIYPIVVLLGYLSLVINPNEGDTMKKWESIGVAAGLGEGLTEAPTTAVIGVVILIWDGISKAPLYLHDWSLCPLTKGHIQVVGTVISLLMYIKTVGTWHLYCRDKTQTPSLLASLKASIYLLPDIVFRILAMSVMVSILRWNTIFMVVPLFLFSWILAIRAGQVISTKNIDHPILTASISLLCPLVFGNSSGEKEEDQISSHQIMKYQCQYINTQRKISLTILILGLIPTVCLIGYNHQHLKENGKLIVYGILLSVILVFGVITLIQSFYKYPKWLEIEEVEEILATNDMSNQMEILKNWIIAIKEENTRAKDLVPNTPDKIFRARMLYNIVDIFIGLMGLIGLILVRTENVAGFGALAGFQRLLPSCLLTISWIVNAANDKKYNKNAIFFFLSMGLLVGPILYPIGTLAGYIWLFRFPFMKNDLKYQGLLAPFTSKFASLAVGISSIIANYISFHEVEVIGDFKKYIYNISSLNTYNASVWIHLTLDNTKYPSLKNTMKTSFWLIPHLMFRMLSIIILLSVLRWYSAPIFGFMFLSNLMISIRTSNHLSSGLGNSLTTSIISILVPVVYTGYNTNNETMDIVNYMRNFIRKQVVTMFVILFGGLLLSAGILQINKYRVHSEYYSEEHEHTVKIPGFEHLSTLPCFHINVLIATAALLGFLSLLTLPMRIQNNLIFPQYIPSREYICTFIHLTYYNSYELPSATVESCNLPPSEKYKSLDTDKVDP